MQHQIQLNERQARQALDALTRQTTTMEIVDAQMRQLRMIADAAQRKLDEQLEAIFSVFDMDLPRNYQVRLTGTTLEIQTQPEQGEELMRIVHVNERKEVLSDSRPESLTPVPGVNGSSS
jgi:ABC-type transporter MlaC component